MGRRVVAERDVATDDQVIEAVLEVADDLAELTRVRRWVRTVAHIRTPAAPGRRP
ncbi:hypothetical protein [Amycolatopsis thailandensis]|uniref:hypothetical protein n=1 Tax=Amycolatopsis thailandensis TaxID=589330 RepID=UPI00142DB774|nr:hypothetical protein [Amycolatopsis thailandensis]